MPCVTWYMNVLPVNETTEYVTTQQAPDSHLQQKHCLRNNRRLALNPGWDTHTSWFSAPMLAMSLANLVTRP